MHRHSKRRAAFQGRPSSFSRMIPFLLLILVAFSPALYAQDYAFLNASDLALNRQRLSQPQTPELTLAAWQSLHRAADKALKQPLLSVTDKGMTPPGGSKHDYLSLSAYWWPDSRQPDGLPWVKRDGHVNPASKNEQSDGVRLATFTASVQTLTLAWYFSGDRRYADKAIALIRHWFINPATRMNPNLKYAQGVPGIADRRHTGVLDGRYFATRLVDSLIALRQAPGWRAEDEQQMQRWMKDYLAWLLTSPEGRGEAAAKNNHGSWYSAQVAGIAWYVERPDVIREMIHQAQRRMAGQLTADGRQPLELARTRSFHYSWFNLQALTALATVAGHSGAGDLWHYRTPQGAGLLTALDFMAPWSDGAKRWPWPSLDHVGVRLIPLMVQADNQLKSQRYRQSIEQVDWALPEARAARGATLDALRASWLLQVPAYGR
ncbi:alginate lyase family protein [Erwinia sp. SLM-02]|uniref:alginate lyase family protein n=1 Tax=Erwinia sp. SLM-02 TaxID=3020057 RepID=UPI00307FE268